MDFAKKRPSANISGVKLDSLGKGYVSVPAEGKVLRTRVKHPVNPLSDR